MAKKKSKHYNERIIIINNNQYKKISPLTAFFGGMFAGYIFGGSE